MKDQFIDKSEAPARNMILKFKRELLKEHQSNSQSLPKSSRSKQNLLPKRTKQRQLKVRHKQQKKHVLNFSQRKVSKPMPIYYTNTKSKTRDKSISIGNSNLSGSTITIMRASQKSASLVSRKYPKTKIDSDKFVQENKRHLYQMKGRRMLPRVIPQKSVPIKSKSTSHTKKRPTHKLNKKKRNFPKSKPKNVLKKNHRYKQERNTLSKEKNYLIKIPSTSNTIRSRKKSQEYADHRKISFSQSVSKSQRKDQRIKPKSIQPTIAAKKKKIPKKLYKHSKKLSSRPKKKVMNAPVVAALSLSKKSAKPVQSSRTKRENKSNIFQ